MGLGAWREMFAALLVVMIAATPLAWADARTERLVHLLSSSGNYRVRVQSAQSLGRIRDPLTVPALVRALADNHTAVRASAALALGRIGAPEALSSLRRLAADRRQPATVRTQCQRAIDQIQRMSRMATKAPPSNSTTEPPRYYVGVGEMGNTTGVRPGRLERTLQQLVREELLRAGSGIEVAPANEPIRRTKRILQRRNLRGYYVQGSVTRLEEVAGRVHAVVSIMVLSNPERDLRMMLQGRGTAGGQGSASSETEQAALAGAVRGAVSRLAQQLRSQP
jgi:hypothetical protein